MRCDLHPGVETARIENTPGVQCLLQSKECPSIRLAACRKYVGALPCAAHMNQFTTRIADVGINRVSIAIGCQPPSCATPVDQPILILLEMVVCGSKRDAPKAFCVSKERQVHF